MHRTITLQGGTIRTTRATRRYLVVVHRPEAVEVAHGTLVPFAELWGSSDNRATAERQARQYPPAPGVEVLVIDLEGQEG